MKRQKEKVHEAATFLESKLGHRPETAVITGTGLGDAVGHLDDAASIAYGDIPHFPLSTVVSHSGQLTAGTIGDHLIGNQHNVVLTGMLQRPADRMRTIMFHMHSSGVLQAGTDIADPR